MTPQVIPFESKRLSNLQRSGAFQHLGVGVILAEAGLSQLSRHPGEDVALALFSLTSGAILIIAVIVEIRHWRAHRKDAHHQAAAPARGINWMDVIAVPSLIAEGWHKHHRGAHYLPYVYFGLAAFTLLRALLIDRLIGSPRVEIDDRRLFIRTSPFRSRVAAWADVVGLARSARGVELQLANGSRVLFDLRDAVNRDVVEQAITASWTAIEAARLPPVPPVQPSPVMP